MKVICIIILYLVRLNIFLTKKPAQLQTYSDSISLEPNIAAIS